MGFLPGNHKPELRRMLVHAWNEIALTRQEAIKYESRNGGFDWIVAFLIALPEGREEIRVLFFSSANQARSFREHQSSATLFHNGFRVIGSCHPHEMLIEESVGLKTYQEWREEILGCA